MVTELFLKGLDYIELIIIISDQLKAWEIILLEATSEESSVAEARLYEVRKKRRNRHAKKKQPH